MKLSLNTIVGRPVVSGGVAIGFEFVEALKKLGGDPISIKDRYALARTLKDIADWIASYNTSRDELVKKCCLPAPEFRKLQCTRLQAKITEAETSEIKNPALPAWRKTLSVLQSDTTDPSYGQGWMLDPEDAQKKEQFEQGMAGLLATECEVFLDHKIKLSADSKLTGPELMLLLDLVEAPE